jgi:pimeloyl-ACP methyl ester carboxylesterase
MSTYTDTWTDGHGTVQYFTRSDGSRLRYFTAGSGPVLVLMHTIRTQMDYFHRVIPQLWDSFTVYAVDLPGMGWSDIVPGAHYEERDLRAAVVEFVTGLDLHDVTLAGESLGGALALQASVDLKDRVSRVVAFNSYDYPRGLERGNLFARFIISSIRMPVLGPVFAAMENRPIMTGIMRGGVVANATLSDDFIVELRKSGRRKGYAKVARSVYRSLKGFAKARDRYGDVAVPVTLVYSDQDWSRPAERERVAGLLEEVERITLPDTGHFSALERPNEVARILRRTN